MQKGPAMHARAPSSCVLLPAAGPSFLLVVERFRVGGGASRRRDARCDRQRNKRRHDHPHRLILLVTRPMLGAAGKSNAQQSGKPFAVSRTCETKLRAMHAPVSPPAILHGLCMLTEEPLRPRALRTRRRGSRSAGSAAARACSSATACWRRPLRTAPGLRR